MDKRYQVFISSTFADLQEERNKAIEIILKMDHIPSGMESFKAANNEQWKIIERVIDECDYYLVIVAGRYGSIYEDTGKSYTQMEYEYALNAGKPIIGFVHKNPLELPAGKCEHSDEGRENLEEFRKLVQKKPVSFYTTPAELASEIAVSLPELIRTNPATGWIKADTLVSLEEEIKRLKEQLELARPIKRQDSSISGNSVLPIQNVGLHWTEISEAQADENIYNVPRFIAVSDNKNGMAERNDLFFDMNYRDWDRKNIDLCVGDIIKINLEMDSAFDENDYVIEWHLPADQNNYARSEFGKSIEHQFLPFEAQPNYTIICHIYRKNERFIHGKNDALRVTYKVLPLTE